MFEAHSTKPEGSQQRHVSMRVRREILFSGMVEVSIRHSFRNKSRDHPQSFETDDNAEHKVYLFACVIDDLQTIAYRSSARAGYQVIEFGVIYSVSCLGLALFSFIIYASSAPFNAV